MGAKNLKKASELAVLNANYVRESLRDVLHLAYDKPCMHECVFSADKQKEKKGVSSLNIAKCLIDKGIHPPTIYFPLIVKESFMIEPTETESKDTLDEFIKVMIEISELADKNPEAVKKSPVTTRVQRPDELKANKELKIAWKP